MNTYDCHLTAHAIRLVGWLKHVKLFFVVHCKGSCDKLLREAAHMYILEELVS